MVLVDDSGIFLTAMRRFFSAQPQFVIQAAVTQGDNALDLPTEPAPAVVLLDIYLPGRSGIRFIRPLKEKWPHAKIVVLTFSAAEQYRELALRTGADEFVSKLYIASDLIPAIERALQN